MEPKLAGALPPWVPEGAQRYLAHTEAGLSIRELARVAGCHASTIMRQVRRVELRRDDPLVDAALTALAATLKTMPGSSGDTGGDAPPDATALEAEAIRVMRRLCESGAVLAVAEGMDKAVVVRDDGAAAGTRTAVVDTQIARVLALRDWITCDNPGRVSRYRITTSGRSELARMLADRENRARAQSDQGFAEAQTPFGDQHRAFAEKQVRGDDGNLRRVRYNMSESPLLALARRKDRDGGLFLSADLVAAGERLREDFELAQMGPRVAQNWDRFLTGGGRGGFVPDSGVGDGPSGARDRVARALTDLGPGLSDVALRCCCYLEGLELAEKRMGWSARSGKIVLRIALQRLKRHYDEQAGTDRMIG
ncbi:DUF6456 domain-containing protein [Pukyongiella litopenaei]|uniref:Helix-turn-helix domain-containing protein n=1 Tax=Pukyongiella litopenaei TaxID=2605946 RepID=A0A2S0MVH2_9RHOB|nr:DUF6456 domain-containing protein [Pukyongiella litopenaei]AVO39894.1 helix-turn-helix domain-containing protein [Pukyongiella litopenaei]